MSRDSAGITAESASIMSYPAGVRINSGSKQFGFAGMTTEYVGMTSDASKPIHPAGIKAD
jgi:hypothetical protein